MPTISVRLPEVIVEVKVFTTAPNAPVRHPKQAGLARLEGALELTAEGNFVRNRTASKALLPTRWVGTPASVSSTRSRHHSRASTTVRKCMNLRARPNESRLSCGRRARGAQGGGAADKKAGRRGNAILPTRAPDSFKRMLEGGRPKLKVSRRLGAPYCHSLEIVTEPLSRGG